MSDNTKSCVIRKRIPNEPRDLVGKNKKKSLERLQKQDVNSVIIKIKRILGNYSLFVNLILFKKQKNLNIRGLLIFLDQKEHAQFH